MSSGSSLMWIRERGSAWDFDILRCGSRRDMIRLAGADKVDDGELEIHEGQ